jgi:putative lipoic acid-binding regulatory protein
VEEKMGIIDLNCHKVQIDYPCSWKYKIIAKEEEHIHKAVYEIIKERAHTLEKSNQSKKGKFKSYTLELMVHNEEDRVIIYDMLINHPKLLRVL